MTHPYSSESKFSQVLCRHFRELGYFVQRIESGTTGRGIPDLFVVTHDSDYWFELKNVRVASPTGNREVVIPWRPGQQGWALSYHNASNWKRCTFTLVAFTDSIGLIPMTKRYVHNTIKADALMLEWDRVKDIRL